MQHGPTLRAIPFSTPPGQPVELLSAAQRETLIRMATLQGYASRTVVYRAGEPAKALFIIGEGAIKSFRDLRSGRRRIAAFLFAGDMFGLAAAGHYVNTVQALMPLMVYRLDLLALAEAFERDSQLQLQFLCKTVHTLREAQHHTIIVGRRDAGGRLAMLLRLLQAQGLRSGDSIEIPMTRSDMANYLGLTLESVVRACRRLEQQGIVKFEGRHRALILNPMRLEALASAA